MITKGFTKHNHESSIFAQTAIPALYVHIIPLTATGEHKVTTDANSAKSMFGITAIRASLLPKVPGAAASGI